MSERARERRERDDAPGTLPAEPPEPERPPRPAAVEVAAAILIVSGIVSTLTTVQVMLTLASSEDVAGALIVLGLALGVGSVVLGVLVRYGRGWLVAVNVAAVAGFLEFTSGILPGFVFGALDVLVVVLLMREHPWFTWPEGQDEDEAGDGA